MITDASIAEADWFSLASTQKIMRALEAARADSSRFVGGCVRNALMGLAASDIDIATQLTPDQTIKALEAAGLRAIPTGIEHGTITGICDRTPFEITTLRRDVETDGRRAVVAFTEDWTEDAQRRDFRLNALYADQTGQVYDPTGGLPDIAAKRVVFIGEAEQRLREDHLRNLRFFRFTAWYAQTMDETGLKACEALRDGLKQIAAERIWKELLKLLEAPDPLGAVSAMIRAGILEVILPEAGDVTHLARLRGIEDAEQIRFDAMQRLLTLFPRTLDSATAIAARMKTSRAEKTRLLDWAKAPPSVEGEQAVKVWLYGLEPMTGQDVIAWEWANMEAPGRNWAEKYAISQDWQRPEFPLRGADLLAMGHVAGPGLGDVLKSIEQAWIENGFSMEGVNIPPGR